MKNNWGKRFDKEIPVRVLNKDNPQYVLGWNVARESAKSFIRELLDRSRRELLEEIMGKIKELRRESGESKYGQDDYNRGRHAGYLYAFDDLLNALNETAKKSEL